MEFSTRATSFENYNSLNQLVVGDSLQEEHYCNGRQG